MKNRYLFSIFLFILVFFITDSLFAKQKVDVSKAEQIMKSNPSQAAKIFDKYVKENPLASNAADIKYKEGLCYEDSGDYYKAFKSYQFIIDKYPLYPKLNELLDRQYRIGNYYLLISDKPAFGINMLKYVSPYRQRAIEIFEQIVKNAPFSDIGVKAQYRLGYAQMQLREFNDAIDEFKVITERYPGSAYVDDSIYFIGNSYFSLVQGPQYDQYSTEKALDYFIRYTEEYPAGRYVSDASVKIDKLNATLAESLYLIGEYYEKLGYYEAALIYYNDLEERYPDTFFAQKASSKRQILETIVQSELPYKQLIRNYDDIRNIYYSLKRKDTRNKWEIWKKDPLTPDERNRLIWAEKLVKIAKSHVDEAKKIYEAEQKVNLLEILIRDLKKDTQRLKSQLPQEEEILKQLQSGVIPENLEIDKDAKEDVKTLIKKQKRKIFFMKYRISSNEKKILKLGEKLVIEKGELEENRPQLEKRWQDLLTKSALLRIEIDKLLAEADDYGEIDLSKISLTEEKIKWKKLTPEEARKKQIAEEKEKALSEIEEPKPAIIEELAEEAARQKSIMIPYQNQYKGDTWKYWWDLLVGEKDRIKTHNESTPLFMK